MCIECMLGREVVTVLVKEKKTEKMNKHQIKPAAFVTFFVLNQNESVFKKSSILELVELLF